MLNRELSPVTNETTRREWLEGAAGLAASLMIGRLIRPLDALGQTGEQGFIQGREEPSHFYDTSQEQIAGGPLVESDSPLPPKLQEKFTRILLYHHQYLGTTKPRLFVPDSISSDDSIEEINPTEIAQYDPKTQRAVISSNLMLSDIGVLILNHELNHALLIDYESQETNKSLLQNLYGLYSIKKIELGIQGRAFSDTCSDQYAPVLRALDESNYRRGIDCAAGHPASNYNELFASVLSCIKYFEPKLIAKLKDLDGADYAWTAKVIKTVIGITDEMSRNAGAPQPFIDPNSPLRRLRRPSEISSRRQLLLKLLH